MTQPRDRREYVRITVDLPLHPKLAAIDEPAAGWLYVVSLCYCGEHLTDGMFTLAVVNRLAGTDREIGKRLISAGMWHEAGHDCAKCPQPPDGLLVVHDYLRHQRSRSSAEQARRAGRIAAEARWGNRQDASGTANGMRSASDPDAVLDADRTYSTSQPDADGMPDGQDVRSACDSYATPNAKEEVEEELPISPSVGGSGGVASQQAAPPPEESRSTDRTVDRRSRRDLNVGRADVERLCVHLADRIEGNGSKRPAITKKWRDDARLLMDQDGKTEEQVHKAIDWCQDDSFWRANVMSMPTLRDKYDQLRLKAKEQADKAKEQKHQDAPRPGSGFWDRQVNPEDGEQ
jgi:hypothetical protein